MVKSAYSKPAPTSTNTAAPGLLCADDIQMNIRSLATRVYNLSDLQEINRWSSHSLRVGAATLLHASGFTGTQIKFLLRWESDTYMKYLRNFSLMSTKHVAAVNNLVASADNPNLPMPLLDLALFDPTPH